MRTNSYIVTDLKKTGAGWTPYVPIYYYTSGAPHDAGGEWSRIDNLGSKNRIIDIRDSIEPYAASCTITLDNSDSSYDATASTYKGKWLDIRWGLYCSSGYRVAAEAQPYFYCIGYSFVSEIIDGRSMDVLKLYGEGAWNRLGRLMAVPDLDTPANGAPFYYNQPLMDATRDGYDADDIFSQLCDMAGIFKSTLGAWSDYVTSWEPEVTFDYDTTVAGHVGPTGDVAAMLILQPFRVRAVPRADGLYLTVPGVATDWTFKCPTDASYQPFNGGYKTSMESLPAKVTVVCGGYDGTYGSSSIGGYNYDLANAWNLCASDANCAWVAQSIVELISEQQESGVIDVPILNPLLELYDYVTVVDQRGNVSTTTGRVGGLFHHYAPAQGIYGMKVRLGGLATDGSSGSGGGAGYGPAATSPEVIKVRTGPHGIANDALISKLFQPGLKPWSSTVVFAPKTGDEHDSVQWAAGVIKWNDGVKADQTIDAGSIDNVTVSTPTYIYFTEGDSSLNSSTDIVDAMGNTNGLLAIVYHSGTYVDSEIGIQCFKSKGDNWNGEFIAAKSISTVHLEAECITTEELAANAATIGKLTIGLGNMIDDPNFDRSVADSAWVGWTELVGTGWLYAQGTGSYGGDSAGCYAYCADTADNQALVSAAVPCNYGEIVTATAYVACTNTGIKSGCEVYLYFYNAAGTVVSSAHTHAATADTNYHLVTVTGTSSSVDVVSAAIMLHITGAADPIAANWKADCCSLSKSSSIVVQGTPGGTRTEITPDGFSAYNGSTQTFNVSASTGRVTACALEVPVSYSSGNSLFNADVAATDYAALSSHNLDKGCLYALSFTISTFDAVDETTEENMEEVELEVHVTDSDNNDHQRWNYQYDSELGGGVWLAYVTRLNILAYSGPATGSTTPNVHGTIYNRSGVAKHYHVTLTKSKVLG